MAKIINFLDSKSILPVEQQQLDRNVSTIIDDLHTSMAYILGSEHLLYYFKNKEMKETKQCREVYFHYIDGMTYLCYLLDIIIQADYICSKSAIGHGHNELVIDKNSLLFNKCVDLFDISLYQKDGDIFNKKNTFVQQFVRLEELYDETNDLTDQDRLFLYRFFNLFAISNSKFYNLSHTPLDRDDTNKIEHGSVLVRDERPLIFHSTSFIDKLFSFPDVYGIASVLRSPIMTNAAGHFNFNYQDLNGRISNSVVTGFFSKAGYYLEGVDTIRLDYPKQFKSEDSSSLIISLKPSERTLCMGALGVLLSINSYLFCLNKIYMLGKSLLEYMNQHDYKLPTATYGTIYLREIMKGYSTNVARAKAERDGAPCCF